MEIDNIFDSTIHFKNTDTKIRSIAFQKNKDTITASVIFKNRDNGEYSFTLDETPVDPMLKLLKEIYTYFWR